MNIQLTIGTVNFSDYLHITAVRVRDGALVWENWYNMPVSSLVVQATGVDADQYYIRMYDSPDNTSLGTLYAECAISGLSPKYEYEIRFYEIGNLPVTASINVAGTIITDPYLIGKTIHSVEKEGFRKMDPSNEFTFTDTTGDVEITNGTSLATGEKLVVVIQNPANNASIVPPQFAGTIDISTSTYTIAATDKNCRFRCVGSGSTQVTTLPSLALLSDGDFVYIDNTVGGTPLQEKLLTAGSDRVLFNGFNFPMNSFPEFWVGSGEALKLMKNGSNWEVASNYYGHMAGERIVFGGVIPIYTIPETGLLYVADNYPRKKWWLQNVLDSSAKIVDNTITSGGWTRPSGKEEYYFVTSTYSHFRTPDTDTLVQIFLRRI